MKLSKKILTFLLPATTIATAAIAVTTSCSCNSESFSFVYGDSINCFKKIDELPDVTIHSLNIVKSESKKHVNLWGQDTVSAAELTAYVSNPQNVYYDLIASVSNNVDKQFAMKWDEQTDGKINLLIEINNNEGKKVVNDLVLGTDVKYQKTDETGKNDIMLNIDKDGVSIKVKSYNFKNATISA